MIAAWYWRCPKCSHKRSGTNRETVWCERGHGAVEMFRAVKENAQ